MRYRLTLRAGNDTADKTTHLIYEPEISSLTSEDGDGAQISHPGFAPDGPVSWEIPKRVSPDDPGTKSNIRTLKIQMGFSCNYACAYCNQASWNTFLGGTTEDAHLFLRNLDSWFGTKADRRNGGQDLRIEFWGGEPFVYWAKLKILGEELRSRYPMARFNVITNGSLLDDEKVDWLIAYRFGVQISHDGPQQKHRHPEDILDDPEKVRLIRRLMTAAGQLGNPDGGFGDDNGNPDLPRFGFGFGTVLTRWNFSLAAVRQHIESKLAVPPGSISSNTEEILLPYDDDAMTCVPSNSEEHRHALHTLFGEAANGETVPGCNSVRNKIEDFFSSLATQRPIAALGQKCGMDREDVIAVNLMGDVTTCHNVSASDAKHNLGNVRDLKTVRLDSAHHHQTREECPHCPVIQLCKGSCMFLEGRHWQAACDVSFTYNLAMLASGLFYLTGMTLTRIEALDGDFIRRPGMVKTEVIRLARDRDRRVAHA